MVCVKMLLAVLIPGMFLPVIDPVSAAPREPANAKIIFDMDSVRHRAGEVTTENQQKVPIGSAELVDGKIGKAVHFSFRGGLGPGFMTAPATGSSYWDQAEGFSFYVKGDGSTNWAGLELIDREDYSLRYGYCFPLDSIEWRKIVVPWRDLIPELAAPLIDPRMGYAPSRFGNFWFGKWFYWRDYPAHAFAIDEIVLEDKIAQADEPSPPAGLARTLAKLRAHEAITLVTMGDSLSDKRHWANQKFLWSEELVRQLREKYRSATKLVNPAIGGTTLSQNLVLMPRWLRDASAPDLVIVWFGFNDWDTGVRGARFKEYLRLAVDRIRRLTHQSADILLLTTAPAFKRWDSMKELEQAVLEVAAEKQTGVADLAAAFRRAGTPEQALQQGYWAWDNVHLGTNGHRLVAETVFNALASEK
jgi:lysophospholipase L1-like esterase